MSYERISQALLHAAAHYREQPSLEALAARAGYSPAHFQRRFQALVGLSPKSFVQHLSARRAAADLRSGKAVLDSALDAGLSGPGRLHDLMVQVEGATPGQVAGRGQGLVLRVAALPTPWGRLFAAQAPRGLAFAAFADGAGGLARARRELRRLWPKAALHEDPSALRASLGRFQLGRGSAKLWVPGTPFQLQVWRALVRVPSGACLSYQGLAQAAGVAGARAVGSAVAANPVALLIPCHRVLRASGAVGDYHWGTERKAALLACEAGRAVESPVKEHP
ncbi:MAG TPA: methylated-DNA--[protein]-cysteine S-methyltransferase [bacterium]|nr:methylated-DNA--[protein]-cysteine S-methyltransferase [bacterium]